MPHIEPAVSEIRAFHPDLDSPWLHRLWEHTLNARWSLSIDSMRRVLAEARLSLVAERDGRPVGFCAGDYQGSGDAGILVLLVEPSHQRNGVGSALLLQMESMLCAEQVSMVHLGAVSTGTYFWPGVPAENDSSWSFFRRQGWQEKDPCADLVQELASFQTPLWVSDRLRDAKIVLRLADFQLRIQAVEFEWANFPAWAPFVENALAESGDENLLIAQSADGGIVGTILMKAGISSLWACDSGIQVGSLNILGVAPDSQRQGIGLALTARAMEILRERRCSRCYIQWTGLKDWYGKLGAQTWAEYRMLSKSLCSQEQCCLRQFRSSLRSRAAYD